MEKERGEKKYQPTLLHQFEQPVTDVYLPEELDLEIRARLIEFNLAEPENFDEVKKRLAKLNRQLLNRGDGTGLLAKSVTAEEAEEFQRTWAEHGVRLHIENTIRTPGVGFDFEKSLRTNAAKAELALYVSLVAMSVPIVLYPKEVWFAIFVAGFILHGLFTTMRQKLILVPENPQKLFDETLHKTDVACFRARRSKAFQVFIGLSFVCGFGMMVYLSAPAVSLVFTFLAFAASMSTQVRREESRIITLIHVEGQLLCLDSSFQWMSEHKVTQSPAGVEIGNSTVDLPTGLRKKLASQPLGVRQGEDFFGRAR